MKMLQVSPFLINYHHTFSSGPWSHLTHKTQPEEHPHWNPCRSTDVPWQFDRGSIFKLTHNLNLLDRFSRHIWAHYSSPQYPCSYYLLLILCKASSSPCIRTRNLYYFLCLLKINVKDGSKTPTKGSRSPLGMNKLRRTRSNSIGDRIAEFSSPIVLSYQSPVFTHLH